MAFLNGSSYLLIGLYVFCLYHAYKNGAEQKWYFIIIFFPLIGSIIYLYTHFYSKENVSAIAEGVVSSVNKNHNINKLEKALEFSPSITNKANLADEYVRLERFDDAEALYLSCLEGFNKNDISVNQKLMTCYFLQGDYAKAVSIGKSIENNRDFKKSIHRVTYAQALNKSNQLEEAENHFKEMNSRYSNYPHRMAYIQFLQFHNRHSEANEIIERIEIEWQNMNRQERKLVSKFKSDLNSLKN